MVSNLDCYREDLDFLIAKGDLLFLAMQKEYLLQDFDKEVNYQDPFLIWPSPDPNV
jgi:hypothetical protein